MKLEMKNIHDVFNGILNSKTTREEADRWAYKIMLAFDSGNLEFVPLSDEQLLWSAIQYLHGIDSKISQNEYLHSLEEIQEAFEENWKF